MRRLAAVAVVSVLLLAAPSGAGTRPSARAAPMETVIVYLRDQAAVRPSAALGQAERLHRVVSALRAKAASTQVPLSTYLSARKAEGRVARFRPFWIFNGFAVRATQDVIDRIAARADVLSVEPSLAFKAPAPVPATVAVEANIALVRAPELWELGVRGRGTVIASVDTGVDVSHPDLAAQWRGGANSWFDPNGEHPDAPFDANGHGTWTMGVMVGSNSSGTAVGIAPEASWIAVKMFDDSGRATSEDVHAAFQWLLDPDGDPTTADAPDVVNNSWTFDAPGCQLEFEPDLQALRSAGIVPVFAAGNSGPADATSMSPANNPGALAVGAVDDADYLFSLSSRGPSLCGEPESVYPELVAPGVDVLTTDLFGLYWAVSGTSLAAPHVTGALALLSGAFPDAPTSETEDALLSSAVDLGAPGPDDAFGYGRLDVFSAYERLAARRSPPLLDFSLAADAPEGVAGLAGVKDEDVVSFDGATFQLVLDGSDVGLAATDIDALAVLDANTFLLSFNTPVVLPRIGSVDDSDIVRFRATSLGSTTTGRFSRYFDGSDVGLTTAAQDVDGIETLPNGRLLLSTRRATRVGNLTVSSSDLVRFRATSLGRTTRGRWSLYFDGSDASLEGAGENLDGVAVLGGSFYLSTAGAFSVPGLAGNDEDVFACQPTSLGPSTGCSFAPNLFLDGSAAGLTPADVDAIAFPPGLSTGSGG